MAQNAKIVKAKDSGGKTVYPQTLTDAVAYTPAGMKMRLLTEALNEVLGVIKADEVVKPTRNGSYTNPNNSAFVTWINIPTNGKKYMRVRVKSNKALPSGSRWVFPHTVSDGTFSDEGGWQIDADVALKDDNDYFLIQTSGMTQISITVVILDTSYNASVLRVSNFGDGQGLEVQRIDDLSMADKFKDMKYRLYLLENKLTKKY